MLRFLSLLLCISLTFIACNSDNNSNAAASNEQTTNPASPQTPAQNTAPSTTATATLPSVPMELVKELYEKCDYIDYVFYYFNFSLSQDKKASIQSTLRQISDEPAVLNPNCKAIGRIFYQIDGENALEADIHLSNECAYFLFYKDGKQAYANKLTPDGVQFFQHIFNQVQK